MKTEKISYLDLAKRVGDCILNNAVRHEAESKDIEFDIYNGEYEYCIKHDTKEECEKDSDNCEFESYEIYQDYIISQSGAEYLAKYTDEIVFYCDELDLYIWGITHFGTGWSCVFTNIKQD
jgi:hypothetical protein